MILYLFIFYYYKDNPKNPKNLNVVNHSTPLVYLIFQLSRLFTCMKNLPTINTMYHDFINICYELWLLFVHDSMSRNNK